MSCNNRDNKKLNGIVDTGQRLTSVLKLLDGTWQGNFQMLSPSYDTIFYDSQEDKLGYLLTGSTGDSSLIRKVIIADTFQVQPLKVDFKEIKDSSLSAIALFTFVDSDTSLSLPITLDLLVNNTGVTYIQFGNIKNPTLSKENPLITEMGISRTESFQQAFSAKSFTLKVDKITSDSLCFSLSDGYGKMLLRKNNAR